MGDSLRRGEKAMYYSITKTLEVMPYISFFAILIYWVILEIKCIKQQLNEKVTVEPIRGNFIPPAGNGYEYYVNSKSVVYILQRYKKHFRIYVTEGEFPINVKIKKDKHGQYFDIRSEDCATVERIIDSTYKNSEIGSI